MTRAKRPATEDVVRGAKEPLRPMNEVVSAGELHWLRVLASDGTSGAVRAHAAELLADGVRESDLRAARVAAWSSGGMQRLCEFAPGGLGVRSELEVKRARAWRKVAATADLDNGEGALFLAALYEAPRPEAWQETPSYGPSPAVLAADLAGRIAELRQRAWTAAWEYTPKGYRLKKGATDPAAEWFESPKDAALRAFGLLPPTVYETREAAGQLRLAMCD